MAIDGPCFHDKAKNGMLELLTAPEVWMAFLALVTMEIVLGIDNLSVPLGVALSWTWMTA